MAIDIKQLAIKIFIILGLYISFVISGIFEERLYKGFFIDKNNKKFRFELPMLALFLNGLISYLIASFVLSGKTYKKPLLEGKDKYLLGLYNLISRVCAEKSLRYVDFIMKIIGKSCKSGAIILVYYLYSLPFVGDIFRKLINEKKEEKKENQSLRDDVIKVCITTASIILFNLEDSSSSKDAKKSNTDYYMLLIGYVFIACSLLCDGIVGLKEKVIGHKVHNDPDYADYNGYLGWEYNKLFSLFFVLSATFSISTSIIFSNGLELLMNYIQHFELVSILIYYTVALSIGQVFIYLLLEKYGPLTLSMVTGVRKILSIALSIILFGKDITFWKMVSLILGTLVIFWEIYDKVKSKKPKVTETDKGEDKKNK